MAPAALHHTERMMRIYRDISGPCLAPGGAVLAVGALDGIHRGHTALLTRVRERALAQSLLPAVISFEPLPRAYFNQGAALPRLGSVRDKLQGFATAGMRRTLLLRFNAGLVAMSAEDFVQRILCARMGAKEVWVGKDFRFGHGRKGDLHLLQQLGSQWGFSAHALETHSLGEERISSSRIREALAAGDFAHASRLLGRPFTIGGRVVRGMQLGHQLGYPTANLRLGHRVAPIGGIFAVQVHGVSQQPMPGVASLGVRPALAGKEPLLEAHLFDFDGDLYGRHLSVEFVAKLRDEENFSTLDALKHQIDHDAAAARSLLGLAASAAGENV